MIRTAAFLLTLSLALSAGPARDAPGDSRLKKSFRRPPQNGWIYVHLEGSPAEIGFQHGYLLASEIEDVGKVVKLGLTHHPKNHWAFFRQTAETVLCAHVESQYQEELRGIVAGRSEERR